MDRHVFYRNTVSQIETKVLKKLTIINEIAQSYFTSCDFIYVSSAVEPFLIIGKYNIEFCINKKIIVCLINIYCGE